MKKLILFSALLGGTLPSLSAQELRRCGNTALLQQVAQEDPSFAAQRQQRLSQAHQQALEQQELPGAAAKSTAQYPIPVVFHVLLSGPEYQRIGRDTGLIRRINSQLAVLNADYSATNADLGRTPGPFQSLIGNAGLQFRLASGTSAYTIAPGIEVKTTTNFFTDNTGYADAKRASQGGLDGWDPTRNLNVWVVATSFGTLGVAIPPSLVGAVISGHSITTADLGLVVSHTAFGKREFPQQYFYPGTNDGGRTLTHEFGHYFELDHVFGTYAGCSSDDGIADTPPQDEPTFSTGTPMAFPHYDNCSPSGNGIMFMNFMDYVDDAEMMLFTKGQVARMQYYTAPGQASYSLTQQPLGIAPSMPAAGNLRIAPNPSAGVFQLENRSERLLSGIQVLDMAGRVVSRDADLAPQEARLLDLSSLAKGLYFLQAQSGPETFTRKIVLQ